MAFRSAVAAAVFLAVVVMHHLPAGAQGGQGAPAGAPGRQGGGGAPGGPGAGARRAAEPEHRRGAVEVAAAAMAGRLRPPLEPRT